MAVSTKFIHAADVHLDSPLKGLEAYEGAPVAEIRGATRRALENLVALAIDEAAAFVVVAGDVYDGDWRDYNTGLFFAKQMARLREAGIEVVLLRGNHDAESEIARRLRLPPNVYEFPTDRAATHRLDAGGIPVALHGRGFWRRDVTEDLAAGYPPPEPGALNVGVLHTSADGRAGHAPYAPTTPADLAARGYDYWALGHVHAREVLSGAPDRPAEPWIVFPGNVQGRHPRETGRKGCTLATLDGRGRIAAVEHRDLDVLRWVVCDVDAGGAPGADEVLCRVRAAIAREIAGAGGRPLAARVRVRGRTPASARLRADPDWFASEVRAAAIDAGAGGPGVWVERVVVETAPAASPAAPLEPDDPIVDLLASARGLAADEAAARAVLGDLDDLRKRLPPEVREGEDGLALDDPATACALAGDVEAVLLAAIEGAGEENAP